jgi:hypothetical protein
LLYITLDFKGSVQSHGMGFLVKPKYIQASIKENEKHVS